MRGSLHFDIREARLSRHLDDTFCTLQFLLVPSIWILATTAEKARAYDGGSARMNRTKRRDKRPANAANQEPRGSRHARQSEGREGHQTARRNAGQARLLPTQGVAFFLCARM